MRTYILLVCLFCVTSLFGQIKLDNPSFEDKPQEATVPKGWTGCETGSTPDILPGFWSVYNKPADGDSYIGLITRSEGSWESIGQRLSSTIKGSRCYEFHMDLAHSKTYAGYDKPIKLRFWGGTKECTKKFILAESKTVSNTSWKKYAFRFTPKGDIDYIIIEAQTADGIFFNYNGNILIDNISEIKPCHQAELLPRDRQGNSIQLNVF